MNVNEMMRKQLADDGYFKEIDIDIGKMRSLAYANIAATAGADLVTIDTGRLKLTAAQNYTNGNVFLYILATLPRDAVWKFKEPGAAASVALAPSIKVRMKAKAGVAPTARTITCAITGTNPDGTAFTTKSLTAALANSTSEQTWEFDFTGQWTTAQTQPKPGAMMQFAFSPSGDIDQDVSLYDIRVLYRGNAAITDDQDRTIGETLVANQLGIN